MIGKLAVLALLGLCVSGDFVDRVSQNFEKKTNARLTQQIAYELSASYFYQSYAHYFARADVALPGFAKWFEKASKEERDHATGLMEYINKRGGEVNLQDLNFNSICTLVGEQLEKMNEFGRTKACICSFMSHKNDKSFECSDRESWKNGLWAMQDTLVLERFVNDELLKLHAAVDSDPHLAHVLEHHYLDEQVDAIKSVADHIRKLQRVGDGLGEYMYDKEL